MKTKHREALFQTFFESSPDAIFIEDMRGNVLDCNPAAAALHGLSREEIVGKNVAELVPPEHQGIWSFPPRRRRANSRVSA